MLKLDWMLTIALISGVYEVVMSALLHDCFSILTQSASLLWWGDGWHSRVCLTLDVIYYVGWSFDQLLAVLGVWCGVGCDELALGILVDEFTWLRGVAHCSSDYSTGYRSLSFGIASVLTTRISFLASSHGCLVTGTLLQEVGWPHHGFVAACAWGTVGRILHGGGAF